MTPPRHAGQSIPPARRVAADDARLSGGVGPDVAEAAAQDARQLEAHFLAEIADLVLRFVDHVAAGFGVLAFGEAVADGPHAAADAVARIDDGDVRAERREIAGGGKAGESCAGNEHGGACQWPCHVNSS